MVCQNIIILVMDLCAVHAMDMYVLFLHGPTLAGFKIKSLVGHEPDQGFNDALVF